MLSLQVLYLHIGVYKAEILYCEGGEALEAIALRSCGCPILDSAQGKAG